MRAVWPSIAMLGLTLTACSQRDASAPPAPTPPAAAELEPSIDTKALQKLSSKLMASGIATRYEAYFDQHHLKAIIEQRDGPPARDQGEYLFVGARLMQYTGSSLPHAKGGAAGAIELKFDLQGRLMSARSLEGSARSVEQAQIDALRARAELLRSHALTQRSTNEHQRTEEERG